MSESRVSRKQSLKGIIKRCKNCQRDLSGRCFVYDQHSADKLRDYCRTCDSYKPRGYPALSSVEMFETEMSEIIEDALAQVEHDVSRRVFIECYVHQEMGRRGLLETWKPPVWVHKTSLRQTHDHQVPYDQW